MPHAGTGGSGRALQHRFDLRHNRIKASRVGNGHFRKRLAVKRNVGLHQTVNELAVTQASFADGGIDADDPQTAEVPACAPGDRETRTRRREPAIPSPSAAACHGRRDIPSPCGTDDAWPALGRPLWWFSCRSTPLLTQSRPSPQLGNVARCPAWCLNVAAGRCGSHCVLCTPRLTVCRQWPGSTSSCSLAASS